MKNGCGSSAVQCRAEQGRVQRVRVGGVRKKNAVNCRGGGRGTERVLWDRQECAKAVRGGSVQRKASRRWEQKKGVNDREAGSGI